MSYNQFEQDQIRRLTEACAEKDKRIVELEKSFQMSEEARKGWLSQFDGYKERLSQARTLIEQIGTMRAERMDIIQAAEKWLEDKP